MWAPTDIECLTEEKWDFLHLANFAFLTLEGSEISVVTFAQAAVMNLSPTVVTEWNR